MTWQPEPDQGGPDRTASDEPPGLPGYHDQAPRPARPPRGRRRLAAFAALLAVGLGGLAVSAIGIAHQLLPRQFSAAQKREIAVWEVDRRWRALPAGQIFPASASYTLPAAAINASTGLTLHASLLGISPQTSCAAGMSAPAARILSEHGCVAVLRATYVDSTGSLVATVAVAVLRGTASRAVLDDLRGSAGFSPTTVRALRVAGTAASGFGDAQRQLAIGAAAGPYVFMSTAGFSDGRRRESVSADGYLDGELASLVQGLVHSADAKLGARPRPPACPGSPGC